VLRAVDERDAYANLLLPSLLTERGITGRDAAFATELTYGTLRGLGTYDAVLAACSDRDKLDPQVRDVLRMGTHQLLATRIGSHAAVATSVDLVKDVCGLRPSGFVNAVLRRVSTRDLDTWMSLVAPDRSKDEAGYLAVMHSYPRWIVDAFRDALGDAGTETEQALAAGNVRPEVVLAVLPSADAMPGTGERTAWSPFGLRLTSGGDPTPLIATGLAAAQDEASQLVALALSRVPLAGPENCWLDLCAGPGGKTRVLTHLAAGQQARLVAGELRPHRARRVQDAAPRAAVVVADGLRVPWQAATFDRVLADAPCSGLGSLRRRPEARWRKTPADIPELAALQRGLLGSAIDSVRPGGVVAYVTCSPHLAETRDVVAAVAAARTDVTILDAPALLPEVPDLAAPSDSRFAQFWPHRHGTDAMFLALLSRGRGLSAERLAPGQPGVADVRPLSLGVAVLVAPPGVGDPGLPGHRVGLLHLPPDDDRAVGQYQRRARTRPVLGLGPGRGPVLGCLDPGDDSGDESEQPAASPGAHAGYPGGHVRRGQPVRHLQEQRGVEDVDPLQVGRVAEDVHACSGPVGVEQDALAPHGAGHPR
jgi:16S rRNA (cytosine967-C5)-methyltransferase